MSINIEKYLIMEFFLCSLAVVIGFCSINSLFKIRSFLWDCYCWKTFCTNTKFKETNLDLVFSINIQRVTRWFTMLWCFWTHALTVNSISEPTIIISIECNIRVRASIQTFENIWQRTRLRREKYVLHFFFLFFISFYYKFSS